MEQVKIKRKRYYKKGEQVWVRGFKTEGVVKELNINPSKGVYKAMVEFKVNGKLLTSEMDLWEIDKLRKRDKNTVTVLFAKVRPNAIIPSKNEEDAGFDIYANFEEDYIEIKPNEIKLIPTGVASCVSNKYALIAKERGSSGTKGMAVRSGVIDSGYRGEIFIPINNTGNKTIVITKNNKQDLTFDNAIIYPYEKAIAQLILVPVPKTRVKEISYEDLKNIPSKRGDGALGSSGK